MSDEQMEVFRQMLEMNLKIIEMNLEVLEAMKAQGAPRTDNTANLALLDFGDGRVDSWGYIK